ncbi:MAG: HD domain-containing protein [bacterium]|nr:HD domain-containing protein [Candidatus Margulisiibacteriota bacterium]
MLNHKNLPTGGQKIIKTLQASGEQAYLVGGCVRDLFLGQQPGEWDITTSAKPDKVTSLFNKVVPTGLDYGTVTVILDDGQYEVTTFRADEKYVDGRHPSNVKFTDDLRQDLSRRDFTINAMAFDPAANKLVDNFFGQADLEAKLIRTVGNPLDRFSEDGLRSVRACRFAAKLGFKIEERTFAAISKTIHITKKVAPERIHDEIMKLLRAPEPSIGFEQMRLAGLLKLILPELEKCFGIKQPNEFHNFDVYWHNLKSCDAAPVNNPLVRLAALLHDIEKPSCEVDQTFYNHDKVGQATAKKILKRLKFSRSETEKVANLVSHHMFNYTQDWTDAAVRRFIRRIGGLQNIPDLFALRQADAAAMKSKVGAEYLTELQKRVDKIIKEQNALQVTDLKINGNEIMKSLKIKPGPKIGQILNFLLEKVLDNPELNEKETLINLAKKHA